MKAAIVTIVVSLLASQALAQEFKAKRGSVEGFGYSGDSTLYEIRFRVKKNIAYVAMTPRSGPAAKISGGDVKSRAAKAVRTALGFARSNICTSKATRASGEPLVYYAGKNRLTVPVTCSGGSK